jgi:uncharacterized protein YoxC
MDITPETLGSLSKDGILAVAVIYLWTRVVSVTDAYLASIKEMAKVVQDNTVATLGYTKSMDSLTDSINKLIEKGVK